MATKQIYLSGKVKWMKVKRPDEKYSAWKLDLALDNHSQQVFDSAGLQLQPKHSEEDKLTYYSFRRDFQRLQGQEIIEYSAPPVTDAQGEPLDVEVGNGSEVTIRVSVFDTRKGKGHRLEAVRVDNLIVFEREPSVDEGTLPPVGDPF